MDPMQDWRNFKGGNSLKRTSIIRKVCSGAMALLLMAGLIPAGLAAPAEAAETGSEMWEIALENGYTHYDTIDMCGGNSHLQGICVDDKMEYMYFSYTSSLAKVDMKTGEVVGSVGGFGQGSFGTPGGAHLGCLAYYDGKIYGSLEYKDPGKKFFIAVFDEDAITDVGMDIKEMDTGVYGILLEEPTADFRDPLNDSEQITSEDGFAVNEENLGHKFGCSGIDGVTFGTMPGDPDGKTYLFVAYGIYGNTTWGERYDNNYNVLQVYDPEKFDSTSDPVLRRFTYERGLSLDYEADEALTAEDTLYVWTGTTGYGSQNLEFDKDTGDLVLYTYDPIRDWSDGHTLYVVDGSQAPVEREIEEKELTGLLERWLRSMDREDQILFVRRYWNGMALKELAKEQAVSPGKLAQRMYRLRLSLKAALEEEGVRI